MLKDVRKDHQHEEEQQDEEHQHEEEQQDEEQIIVKDEKGSMKHICWNCWFFKLPFTIRYIVCINIGFLIGYSSGLLWLV